MSAFVIFKECVQGLVYVYRSICNSMVKYQVK